MRISKKDSEWLEANKMSYWAYCWSMKSMLHLTLRQISTISDMSKSQIAYMLSQKSSGTEESWTKLKKALDDYAKN